MNASSQRDSWPDPRHDLIQQLQRQLGRAGAAAQDLVTPAADLEIFSSGSAALDRLLPGGGLRHGMLVEWLGGESSRGVEQQGSGGVEQKSKNYSTTPLLRYCSSSAATLSLLAAREACRQGGVLVVIDEHKMFYPPAAAAWGIDLARLIVVHPQTARDALWAVVQSLRSPAAAVWTAIDRLDSRAFRRLQLAAEAGHTLGLLLRPGSVRGQPSWADVQVWVGGSRAESQESRARTLALDSRLLALDSHRRVHVRVTRCRGARPGGRTTLEIDDAAHTVREVEEGYRLSAVGYQPSLLADSR